MNEIKPMILNYKGSVPPIFVYKERKKNLQIRQGFLDRY